MRSHWLSPSWLILLWLERKKRKMYVFMESPHDITFIFLPYTSCFFTLTCLVPFVILSFMFLYVLNQKRGIIRGHTGDRYYLTLLLHHSETGVSLDDITLWWLRHQLTCRPNFILFHSFKYSKCGLVFLSLLLCILLKHAVIFLIWRESLSSY